MKKISLPKIGIRPVIDGRRMGVRESLEEQTMNMAKATAALITEKNPPRLRGTGGVRHCRYLYCRYGGIRRL
ncbi:L-fucose isomerase [Salmonella enterica subsp. diarizonae]|nr:L-fucose isomerase [Salmonella enterica subsp. diarizonae]